MNQQSEQHDTKPESGVDPVEMTRQALVRVLGELAALADEEAGGTTTMNTNVKIPWKDADAAVWKVLKRCLATEKSEGGTAARSGQRQEPQPAKRTDERTTPRTSGTASCPPPESPEPWRHPSGSSAAPAPRSGRTEAQPRPDREGNEYA